MNAESDSDRAFEPNFDAARPSLLESFAESARGLYATFAHTLYCVFRGRKEPGAVIRQMYEIGNRSLIFVSVVMGFIGMILVFQGGLQTQRVVPDLSGLGAAFLEILVRDLSASICALMLATRVGAGIAAEIGSMVVTEQIDALRMCAADPVDYLVKPRFLASICMTLVLVVIAGSVAYGTGMGAGYVFFGINPRTFINLSLVDPGDVIVGVAKCLAYGAAIPVVSAHAGLTTFGGSAGVGAATTRAVVNSSLAVIALDFLISGAGYLAFP
ncbi:MAG TPA: ABC transporter permease [Polyangiaceae bacterium]|nr:ABC transporter permease [Polyangiaceae bacterium]